LFYISQFIDEAGALIEPDSNFFSEENLQLMESLLKDQEKAGKADAEVEKLMKEIKKNVK
jgi:hypothetical protein